MVEADRDRFAELERRYDGPIPEPLRRLTRLGSAERVLLAEAEAQCDFFRSLIIGQIAALRHACDADHRARLRADLVLYRRHRRFWRRAAQRLELQARDNTPFVR